MKFSEWLEQSATSKLQGSEVFVQSLPAILYPDTEILESVVHHNDGEPGFTWRHRFILVCPTGLVIGHVGFRAATEKGGQAGRELHATAIPLDSIASVSYLASETNTQGWPESQHRYKIEFKGECPAMSLPPDADRMETVTFNGYMAVGQALMSRIGYRA